MTAAVLLASSMMTVLVVLALVREVRRRRALQILLYRLLKKWRSPQMSKLLTILLFLVGLALVSGCDDDKAQVAEASRQLVEADAKSRTETVALQRDLQQGQTELGRQRDQLEDDRRGFADQRNRDPIIANTLTVVGTIIACLLPLILGIYLAGAFAISPKSRAHWRRYWLTKSPRINPCCCRCPVP